MHIHSFVKIVADYLSPAGSDRADQPMFKGPRGIIAFKVGKGHVFNTPNTNDNIYSTV